jgi:hypothetical protein
VYQIFESAVLSHAIAIQTFSKANITEKHSPENAFLKVLLLRESLIGLSSTLGHPGTAKVASEALEHSPYLLLSGCNLVFDGITQLAFGLYDPGRQNIVENLPRAGAFFSYFEDDAVAAVVAYIHMEYGAARVRQPPEVKLAQPVFCFYQPGKVQVAHGVLKGSNAQMACYFSDANVAVLQYSTFLKPPISFATVKRVIID